MKVVYFTCMENTCNNDIHTNQVLSLLNHEVDYFMLFLSPKFILNKAGFSINRHKFENKNVKEVKMPILSYHFGMHLFIIPYFILVSFIPFLFFINKVKPDVIHCRNLISSFLTVIVKKVFRKNYKIVCDPRSVYVEEQVIFHTFRNNGINHRTWKKIEAWIYKNSDACLGLSENFADYLKSYNENSFYVPAVVSDSYSFSQERRQQLRQEKNLSNNDVVCCYIGSIGAWHSVDCLFESYEMIKQSLPPSKTMKILFLSGNTKACNRIKSSFSEEDIVFCGRVKPSEILDYLIMSDVGLVPGTDNKGDCYDLLYHTMISSKAEEYLGAGLPIVVNPRITSLVKMLKDINGGVEMKLPISLDHFSDRTIIAKYAHDNFSVAHVVSAYNRLYINLFNRQ